MRQQRNNRLGAECPLFNVLATEIRKHLILVYREALDPEIPKESEWENERWLCLVTLYSEWIWVRSGSGIHIRESDECDGIMIKKDL